MDVQVRWHARPVIRLLMVAGVLGMAVLGLVGVTLHGWWRQAIHEVDRHVNHHVAHPGWSFPARIYSPSPEPNAQPWQRVVEARARGYVEHCPEPNVGEFCERNGKVVPRSGDALEPLLMGWMVGPDAEIREHLPLEQALRHLVDAIVAAEDRDFWTHRGVHFAGIARAALTNVLEGSYAQGGSTLTMQVVRGFLGHKEKTLRRKLREVVMALAVDRHLGKNGVMQAYLDMPYLGQQGGLSVCGFQAASRHYFGKDVREITMAEAATLAAILPGPARFAPDRFPERARERRDRVLRAMHDMFGYNVDFALYQPVVPSPAPLLMERFPAYLSATRAWLEARLAPEVVYGSGLTVTAAMDLSLQQETERVLSAKTRMLEQFVSPHKEPLQSAAVLMDVDTGRMRAVWGGSGLTSTGFNRATQARRQPGSSFKPVVYALAMSQRAGDGKPRFTPASTQPNVQRVFKTPEGPWMPRNVTHEYTATASLAYALSWSQNVATVSLLEELGGPAALIPFAKHLGFDTHAYPHELGLALGQAEVTLLEMGQFVSSVANGGERVVGTPVLRAVDLAGKVHVDAPRAQERVMAPETAALTREMMRLVVDAGTGGAVRGAGEEAGYRGVVMGKTGTTDRELDVWFVGATPRWAGVVWIGFDQPQPLGLAASDLAAPLWGWWFGKLHKGQNQLLVFPAEPKLTRKWICSETGKLAGENCRALEASFLPGTEPRVRCTHEHALQEPMPAELPTTVNASTPRYESLWKRLAREKAEREAAQAADGGMVVSTVQEEPGTL